MARQTARTMQLASRNWRRPVAPLLIVRIAEKTRAVASADDQERSPAPLSCEGWPIGASACSLPAADHTSDWSCLQAPGSQVLTRRWPIDDFSPTFPCRPARSGEVGETVHRILQFDRFMLDLARGCLRLDDRELELRPKAFKVLCHLAERAGRLVAKEDLQKAVWNDVVVSDDSLVQCIRQLRRALCDDEQRLIKTVARRGYLLDAQVSELGVDSSAAPSCPSRTSPRSRSCRSTTFLAILKQAYFADGIAEDSDHRHFLVRRRCSLSRENRLSLSGTARHDIRTIGSKLGVRYVVEGSVRRAGSRVRLDGAADRGGVGERIFGPTSMTVALDRDLRASGPDHRELDRCDRTKASCRRDRASQSQARRQPGRLRSGPPIVAEASAGDQGGLWRRRSSSWIAPLPCRRPTRKRLPMARGAAYCGRPMATAATLPETSKRRQILPDAP